MVPGATLGTTPQEGQVTSWRQRCGSATKPLPRRLGGSRVVALPGCYHAKAMDYIYGGMFPFDYEDGSSVVNLSPTLLSAITFGISSLVLAFLSVNPLLEFPSTVNPSGIRLPSSVDPPVIQTRVTRHQTSE